MTDRLSIRMWEPVQARKALDGPVWMQLKAALMAGHRMVVEVKPETRSLEQNARLWAMLTDISEQVDWYGKKLSPTDWKHLFSSTLRKLEVVPNLEGTGFVALGLSTSKMSRKEMAELQELMEAFGAEKGVRFKAMEVA
jgi:hypothetical protein